MKQGTDSLQLTGAKHAAQGIKLPCWLSVMVLDDLAVTPVLQKNAPGSCLEASHNAEGSVSGASAVTQAAFSCVAFASYHCVVLEATHANPLLLPMRQGRHCELRMTLIVMVLMILHV